ncbi:MAG: hypothetical protein ACREDR_34425, partial [Blastocatellia bacterium]
DLQSQPQSATANTNSTITIPAGTTVELMLTTPLWAGTAKPGDSVYAVTAFPVAINNQMAIPPGTYVEGQIDTMSGPHWLSPHAQFQFHFTKIIFANGYTIELPGPQNVTTEQPQVAAGVSAAADDVIAAVSNAYVQVSSSNDILLDNGAQIQMVLQIPLAVNASRVADASRRSIPAQFGPFRSSTQCRPTYGTPGTPDTVIPGTPGTPGTPDTTIPGGPGMPDVVIPGTPATPGTPDTVIPGTPGTPGTTCPGPPVVTSNPNVQHKESFQVGASADVGGKQLTAGSYQVTWTGSGPLSETEILQNGNLIASVQARVVALDRKSPANTPAIRTNADGSLSLISLRFAGQTFALYFDLGTQ